MKIEKVFYCMVLGLVAFSSKVCAQMLPPISLEQDNTFFGPVIIDGSFSPDDEGNFYYLPALYAGQGTATISAEEIVSIQNRYFFDIHGTADITLNSLSSNPLYLVADDNYMGLTAGSGGKLTVNNAIYNANVQNQAIYASYNGEVVYNGGEINVQNAMETVRAENDGIVRLNEVSISGNSGWLFFAGLGGKIYYDGGASRIALPMGGTMLASSDGSLLDIKNTDILTANMQLFDVNGGGAVNLSNVTIDSVNALTPTYLLNLSGKGSFAAENSVINGYIKTSYAGDSHVSFKDSVWNMKDSSQFANLKLDNTVLDMTNYRLTSDRYTTLTLNSLDSSSSKIIMNTFLGGDSSPTDKIILKDATVSGTTVLDVRSTGEDTVKNVDGIKLVDAQGTTTTTSSNFSLLGGQVDSSAYVYKLYRGASGDTNSFYLRNTHQMSDSFNTIANMAAIHLNIVVTGMNELKKRMGELRENSPYSQHGLWVRNYARKLEVSDNITTNMNLYGLETGYDHQIYSDNNNKTYAGIMAGYLYTDRIKTDQDNGYYGRGHSSTPSFGAYATWINKEGWFADATIRHFIGNMKATAYSAQGDAIVFKPGRDFTALSLEGGKKYEYALKEDRKVTFEPKIEATYAYSKSEDFSTSTGKDISYGDTQGISGKIGATVGYQMKLENGSIAEPFLHLALVNEFDGKTDIRYDGAYYQSDLSDITVEVGGGLNAKIDDSWNLYSELIYEKGSVIKALSGNVGVRYNW